MQRLGMVKKSFLKGAFANTGRASLATTIWNLTCSNSGDCCALMGGYNWNVPHHVVLL